MDLNQKLHEVCKNSERYDPSFESRLTDELKHIETQELASYYLAMQKKDMKVETSSHYIAYLLGLTDLFDRDRQIPMMGDMPDIDVDFSEREPVVEYLKEKYGDDHVAYISNNTTLSAASAILDVQRVMEIPVPKNIRDTVEEIGSVRDFLGQKPRGISDDVMKVLRHAANLEGNIRQMAVTAAGVIVSSEPVTNYAALWVSNDKVAAQYNKNVAEDIGFLKMDLLVTTNIAAMEKTMELIEERGGTYPENIWDLPLDDKEMIKEFAKGHTELIFQYGGYALQNLCTRVNPQTIEEVTAINAVGRKGADDKAYVARKNGKEKWSYPHPKLKEILEETYGLMVYQEQVMAICRELAGMSHRDVNRVRKMVGKKTYKEEPELKSLFLMGMKKKGIDPAVSKGIWADIKRHGEYSFNKAHSIAYFLQAWANMYFQVHHPFEWFLANLMLEKDDKKISTIVNAAQRAGIEIGSVDINKSKANWTYSGDTLVPGLASVKGLGFKTGERLAKEAEKSPFIGWNTVITNRKQDERMYYLVQEDSPDPYAKDVYKNPPKGWVMIPKNAFDVLSAAGAIPEVKGDIVQEKLASNKPLDVTEGKDVHKLWKPVPLGKKKDGPCIVHGYVKSSQKRKGVYEIQIQSDIAGSLWYHDKLEPGSYLFVIDGKWERIYMAIDEEKWSIHPLMDREHLAVGTGNGPGVAFFAGGLKKNDRYISMMLCPQPRVLWLNIELERGWYKLLQDKNRHWKAKMIKKA